jgi:carbon-monoxide dehydrogenase large subunit
MPRRSERTLIRPPTAQYPGFTIEDAYAVQRRWVEIKVGEGSRVKGDPGECHAPGCPHRFPGADDAAGDSDRHQSNGFLLLRADHGGSERVMKYGVGQPVRRFEDKRLLTGKGHYQDDLTLPRQLWAVFVRSPHAHARIVSIDTAASAGAPGVAAVFTGQDFANDGISTPKAAMARKKRDGSPMFAPQRPAMVIDRTRYVGDTVAMVIAETLAQAKDAAELVEIEYEALPSVTSLAEAALADAPRVWDENPDNISHTLERGDRAATQAAFVNASHIVRRRYVITRVQAQYMEPRGSIGTYDEGDERYTLFADVNYPHRVRNMLAHMVFNVPESNVRVQVRDVGGGFGAKGWQYVDHRLTLWAAKKLGGR